MWESMIFQMFRNIFHKLSFLCAFSLQIFLRRRSLVELCRFPLLWIRLRLREASEIPISSRIFRRNVLRAMTGIFQVSWRCPVIRVIIQSVTSVFARPSIELTGDGVKPFAFLARVHSMSSFRASFPRTTSWYFTSRSGLSTGKHLFDFC